MASYPDTVSGLVIWFSENYLGVKNHDRVAPGALNLLAKPTTLGGYI